MLLAGWHAGKRGGKDKASKATAKAAAVAAPPGLGSPLSAALPAMAQDPTATAAAVLVNATGGLHHLTSVSDDARRSLLAAAGGLRQLCAVLSRGGCGSDGPKAAVWDHALGAVWNAAQLPGAGAALAAAGAPRFLLGPGGAESRRGAKA